MSDYIVELRAHLIRKKYQPEWMIGIKKFDDLPRIVNDKWDELKYKDRQKFFEQFDHFIEMQDGSDDEDITATIWLIENLKGPWYSNSIGEFYFMEDADALRFKMVWA